MSPAPRIFFDLTTLAHFLARSPTPTGIQRVEISLLGGLLRRLGPGRLSGLLLDELLQAPFEIDLRRLSDQEELTAETLIATLAIRGDRQRRSERLYRFAVRQLSGRARRWAAPRPDWFRPLALRPGDIVLLPGLNLRIDAFYAAITAAAPPGVRYVQIVHDVIALKAPDLCEAGLVESIGRYVDSAIARADHMVCVSEATAADLRAAMAERGVAKPAHVSKLAHQFGALPRNGAPAPDASEVRASVASIAAREDYGLCVGTFEPRKNGAMLLDAWTALGPMLPVPPPPLVFAGRFGWKTEAFRARLAACRAAGATIELVEAPSDAELATLYRAARFTVFPSLYEGWGLPVGESLWFGTPCFATMAPAVPEVGGALCDYFDPTDAQRLASLIASRLTEPGALHASAARIKAAPLRSWDDAAGDLAAVLDRLN